MTLFLIPLYLPEQTVVLIGTVKQSIKSKGAVTHSSQEEQSLPNNGDLLN